MGQAVKEEDRTSCCCFHLFPGSRLEVCFEYIFVIIVRTMIVMAPSKKKSRDSRLSKPVVTRTRDSRPNPPFAELWQTSCSGAFAKGRTSVTISVVRRHSAGGSQRGPERHARPTRSPSWRGEETVIDRRIVGRPEVHLAGVGLPVLADSHLAMSGPPATSTRSH